MCGLHSRPYFKVLMYRIQVLSGLPRNIDRSPYEPYANLPPEGDVPTPSCASKCVDNGADWSGSKHYGSGGYSVCQSGDLKGCSASMMQEIYKTLCLLSQSKAFLWCRFLHFCSSRKEEFLGVEERPDHRDVLRAPELPLLQVGRLQGGLLLQGSHARWPCHQDPGLGHRERHKVLAGRRLRSPAHAWPIIGRFSRGPAPPFAAPAARPPRALLWRPGPPEPGPLHPCQPGIVRCLEASHDASIRPCQPGNVRFLEASDEASMHPCQRGSVLASKREESCGSSAWLTWKALRAKRKSS